MTTDDFVNNQSCDNVANLGKCFLNSAARELKKSSLEVLLMIAFEISNNI